MGLGERGKRDEEEGRCASPAKREDRAALKHVLPWEGQSMVPMRGHALLPGDDGPADIEATGEAAIDVAVLGVVVVQVL